MSQPIFNGSYITKRLVIPRGGTLKGRTLNEATLIDFRGGTLKRRARENLSPPSRSYSRTPTLNGFSLGTKITFFRGGEGGIYIAIHKKVVGFYRGRPYMNPIGLGEPLRFRVLLTINAKAISLSHAMKGIKIAANMLCGFRPLIAITL